MKGNPRRSQSPLLVFAAVNEMAPSSRGAVVQKFLMHACSLVSLVSTCNPKVNAESATNEVVQFFVCCATFVLSVGLLFSTRSCFFSGHVSFKAL